MPSANPTRGRQPRSVRSRVESAVMWRTSPSRYSPVTTGSGPPSVGRYGDGVFRHLARLHRGDRIEARLANGTPPSSRSRPYGRWPRQTSTHDVYGDVAGPELRLITCGGPRDGEEYRDNVIVFAGLSATRGARGPSA
ncbi:hypothetical protein SVIOM342S_03319 [Streptomyces violaceorubidus]